MNPLNLAAAAEGIPSLRAILITAMPGCMLFDAYLPGDSEVNQDDIEDAAAFFGDLIRANRETLKLFGSWSSNIQFTVESDELLYSVWGLRSDFVIGFVFDAGVPSGMIRHFTRRMYLDLQQQIERMGGHIEAPEELVLFEEPDVQEEQPRGVELLEYLRVYAPDPHASMFRISVKTGIPVEELENPSNLSGEDVSLIEQAVCDILGIDNIDDL